MILDSRLEFSLKQTVATTAVSTNVVDLGSARNIGPGRAMWVILQVDEAVVGTGAVATLEDCATEAGSYASIASVTITAAPVGSRFVIGIPYANKRFLNMKYTINTGTGGKVSAWLTDQEPSSWKAYPGVS